MSTALLSPSNAPSAAALRRGHAEVERLLAELRRLVGEQDARADRLRWQIAEAVKADLARHAKCE